MRSLILQSILKLTGLLLLIIIIVYRLSPLLPNQGTLIYLDRGFPINKGDRFFAYDISRQLERPLITLKNRFSLICLTPDGRQLAAYDDGQLIILNLFTQKQEILTDLTPELKYIAWSPDGKQIAVLYDGKLAIIAKNGAWTDIQSAGENIQSIAWSPLGQHITFSQKIANAYFLKQINLQTNTIEILTDSRNPQLQIRYSPDGDSLVYVITATEFNNQIAIWDFEEKQETLIPENESQIKSDPFWSPDAQQIIYRQFNRITNLLIVYDLNTNEVKTIDVANFPDALLGWH